MQFDFYGCLLWVIWFRHICLFNDLGWAFAEVYGMSSGEIQHAVVA